MIWRPRQFTRTPREERRLEAGRLLQAGHLSHAAIARQMGVSRTAVSTWAKQLRRGEGNLESLRNRPVSGRPPRVTSGPWQSLLRMLTQGALQAGFDADRWTLRRVRALILVEFGVEYHAHDLARRLTALGWSPQHPAVYARERDDALVQAWLTHDWARIQKRLAVKVRSSCLSMRPGSRFAKTATTWAPIGRTPILRRMSERRELSTVIGLTLTGTIDKRHVEHAIGATDILVALRHFQRHIAGPMIIIWDRLHAYRAVLVQEYLAAHPELEVAWLPP